MRLARPFSSLSKTNRSYLTPPPPTRGETSDLSGSVQQGAADPQSVEDAAAHVGDKGCLLRVDEHRLKLAARQTEVDVTSEGRDRSQGRLKHKIRKLRCTV